MAARAMSDAAQTPNDSPRENHHGRLACQACQRKKIKCDRTFPCGQCTKSNLQCTQSARKQRTRHAGKRAVDSELRTRITKLESLVQSLSGDTAAIPSPPDAPDDEVKQDPASIQSTPASPSASAGRYVAGPFWSSLSSEVQALRDALEEDEEEVDTPDSGPTEQPAASADAMSSLEYDLIVCPPGRIYVMPGALSEPTVEVARSLLETFLANVEPMYKIFHRPSLVAFMKDGATYMGRSRETPGNLALKRTVWFAAVNSLSETECLSMLGQPREQAINHFKRLVGISFAQADLVNTTDIATVQAFATYLAASRQSDTTRRVWTLTAVLVRIAKALNLHHEDASTKRTPFEIEMRRRIWHSIRFIDVFVAVDRGAEPLITTGTHSVPWPAHSNDAEFGEDSATIPSHGHNKGLTDMSFALMTLEACELTEKLSAPETQPGGLTWEQRHDMARDLGVSIRERYLKWLNLELPYDRLRCAVGEACAVNMMLRVVRPLSRQTSSAPPRVDSPYVLQLAVDSLAASRMVYSDPETQRWNWMTWVPWHGLSVALAGLCSIRGTPLAEKAWWYVDRQYERCEPMIADSKDGMLWKPIVKLYKKATAFRDAGSKPDAMLPQDQKPSRNSSTTSAIPLTSYNDPAMQSQTFNADPMSLPSQPMDAPSTMSTIPPLDYTFTPLDSTFNTMDGLSSNMGALEPFPNDASWMDWEKIMNDFADNNGDLMNGMQWPDGNHV